MTLPVHVLGDAERNQLELVAVPDRSHSRGMKRIRTSRISLAVDLASVVVLVVGDGRDGLHFTSQQVTTLNDDVHISQFSLFSLTSSLVQTAKIVILSM